MDMYFLRVSGLGSQGGGQSAGREERSALYARRLYEVIKVRLLLSGCSVTNWGCGCQGRRQVFPAFREFRDGCSLSLAAGSPAVENCWLGVEKLHQPCCCHCAARSWMLTA